MYEYLESHILHRCSPIGKIELRLEVAAVCPLSGLFVDITMQQFTKFDTMKSGHSNDSNVMPS